MSTLAEASGNRSYWQFVAIKGVYFITLSIEMDIDLKTHLSTAFHYCKDKSVILYHYVVDRSKPHFEYAVEKMQPVIEKSK